MGGVASTIGKALFGASESFKQSAGEETISQQLEEQKKETERMRAQNEEQRREEAEKLAARRSARLRGGSRMLLSEARLTPETGLQQTLGSSEMKS
jgi:hypothetical protein